MRLVVQCIIVTTVATPNVRIGTSGWNYPSGRGTWNGIFYPSRRRGAKRTGFDELSYYAEHFDTVEVNSTFYRIPTPRVTHRWVERTPAAFEFCIKLFQKFTHPKMYTRATGDAQATATADDVSLMRAALDPLRSAGKLGVLLAQFPPSFKNDTESREYLTCLLEAFSECRVAVELRHRSWSDDVGSTVRLLNDHDAAWTQIDEPKFRFSIAQNQLPNVTSFYYMRLHGRNAKAWWHHDHVEDRYDYLYSGEELRSFADTADAARRIVKKLYLYLNNHFAAKAVANAVVLKDQLGIPVDGAYEAAFVDRYPAIREIVNRTAPLTPASLID